jgi:hypothetical protein
MLDEGWYLMSTTELEGVLARHRGGTFLSDEPRKLSVAEALEIRNAGNVPDAEGRSLRLVLHVENEKQLQELHVERLRFEPDFHDAPGWRREGSKPVNVVPLRTDRFTGRSSAGAWWEDERMGELEARWREKGVISGVRIPAEYRGFVYKTIASLEDAGRAVTVQAIADSIARWLDPRDARSVRDALEAANPEGDPEGPPSNEA